MNLYMQQIKGITVKMEAKNETGMVSLPKETSKKNHVPAILMGFREIMALKLPCKETKEDFEFLCEDCPYDIIPKVDCGLAILQERAQMIYLELIK